MVLTVAEVDALARVGVSEDVLNEGGTMSDDLDRLDKLAEAETLATIAIARSLHGGAADHEDFDYYRKHVEIALDAAGVREILAERDAALAREAKVREAVARHPKCDRYDDDGPISCGWKSAFRDVVRALDADGKEADDAKR